VKPLDYARFGPVGPILQNNAQRLDRAFASGLRPPPRIDVAEWAEQHRRFPEESPYPGPWRHETALYLVEIMGCLSPHHPCSQVVCIKCAQSGGSASGENWIGYIADVAPGPALYVQANVRAAEDWARDKLWPMILATPKLDPRRRGAVKGKGEQGGDEDTGSTKLRIKFRRGGSLLLAGSNSAATLSAHTVRYAIEDDLDRFADDVEGQGSPETMVTARLRVYTRQGLSKRFKISTPTIKGASKIGAAWGLSDQRRFYFRCPHCAARFRPEFADLKWPEGKPREAHLAAPCCGQAIEHWQKTAMTTADGWCPTAETVDGDGVVTAPPRIIPLEADFQAWRARDMGERQPGFHIGGIISAFLAWADLCAAFVDAKGDLNKLKAWTNLDLGEEFEVKGNAPDHEKLSQLLEQDWGVGQMPIGPVATTMGVDVQGDGLYQETLGWGPSAESWSLFASFIPGATDVPGEGAWKDLDALVKRGVIYPGGKALPIDQVCVDAGYHTAAAEAFCRGHSNRLAVFGRPGWTLPVLGRGENLRYQQRGSRAGQATKKAEDKAYLVGTYGVKLTFYGYLTQTLRVAEDEAKTQMAVQAIGRCHFGRDTPADHFLQLTSEAIAVRTVNRYSKREWHVLPGRPNHYLDCRVYNHAAAAKLLLDRLTPDDWARLRDERCAAKDPVQGDLLAQPPRAAAPASAQGGQSAHGVRGMARDAWIKTNEGGWLDGDR
jgi:phage terminase large subunit GpA-like protein